MEEYLSPFSLFYCSIVVFYRPSYTHIHWVDRVLGFFSSRPNSDEGIDSVVLLVYIYFGYSHREHAEWQRPLSGVHSII
jgi:hypothetical protein